MIKSREKERERKKKTVLNFGLVESVRNAAESKMVMNRSALSSIVIAHRTGRYAFDTQPTVLKNDKGR